MCFQYLGTGCTLWSQPRLPVGATPMSFQHCLFLYQASTSSLGPCCQPPAWGGFPVSFELLQGRNLAQSKHRNKQTKGLEEQMGET